MANDDQWTDKITEVTEHLDEMMNMAQIARYLGLNRFTITAYHARGQMPKEDAVVRNRPLWYKSTIDNWYWSRPKRKFQ